MKEKLLLIAFATLLPSLVSAQIGIVAHRGYWNCEAAGFARFCPGFTVQYLGSDLWPNEVYDNGLNGIDLNFGDFLMTSRYHDEAREKGMSINVWTINNPEDMQKAINVGIDLLTTDEPLKARHLLGEKEIK